MSTVGWADLKEAPTGGGGNRDIKRLKLGDTTKIRIVGKPLPRYVYWIQNNEGKRTPLECLSFDRATQQMVDSADDPVKEIDQEALGDDASKPKFAYVTNVIDRSDNTIKLFDIKSTIYKQLIELAKNPEYGDPSDEENGYDITITKESTGPKPMNVRYSVTPGRSNTPLTEEEQAMELYDLEVIFKRPDYEKQKTWLIENTKFFQDAVPSDLMDSSEDMQDI